MMKYLLIMFLVACAHAVKTAPCIHSEVTGTCVVVPPCDGMPMYNRDRIIVGCFK